MKNKILATFSDDFIKNNFVFFIGTLFVSFFNYLYYPVLGRLLTVENFGEVQALVSLYMQLLIFLTAFGYMTINILNNHSKDDEKLTIIAELERVALLFTIVFFIFILVFGNSIQGLLKFNSLYSLLALGPLLLISVPFTFRNYFLQGQKKLKEVSIAGIIYSLSKLLLAIVLILLGAKALGAMIGYVVAQAIAFFYVYFKTSNSLPIKRVNIPAILQGKINQNKRVMIKKQLLFGFFIFITILSVTLLYTFDVVIVRKYFSPLDAGLFSGVSTIARIIFFSTASISGVLLASANTKTSIKENRNLLTRSLLLILFVGAAGLVSFTLAPKLIINILLGQKYNSLFNLLPLMSLSMLIASISNLLLTYQIALKRYISTIPAVLGVFALLLLSALNHGSLNSIAINFIAANAITLLGTGTTLLISEINAKKDIYSHTAL